MPGASKVTNRYMYIYTDSSHRTEFLYEPIDGVEDGDDKIWLGELDDERGATLRALHVRRDVPLLLLVHPALDARLVHPLRCSPAPAATLKILKPIHVSISYRQTCGKNIGRLTAKSDNHLHGRLSLCDSQGSREDEFTQPRKHSFDITYLHGWTQTAVGSSSSVAKQTQHCFSSSASALATLSRYASESW